MNPFTAIVAIGILVDAVLLAVVAVRARRLWLQATYVACGLSFVVVDTSFVGGQEGLLAASSPQVILGAMLLAHALTAILVLGLIHGETLPRRRSAAFLLLAPVPILTYLAPIEGWSTETVFEGNPVGGFLVLCLGIALAEAIYVRYTSRLLAPHSFWLSLGIISLIVAGPVYTYEMERLGGPVLAGANVATPLALACFAIVALQASPFPVSPRPSRGGSGPGFLRGGEAIVFDEARPKYAPRTAQEESTRGRSTLVLGRTPPRLTAGRVAFASIALSRWAALRTLTTASEFFAASPGGLAVLDGLADLSVLSGWGPTFETVVRLRYAARDTGSTVVLSASRLTEAERRTLRGLRLTWWSLPDPTTEIDAILGQSFGSGASRLLEAFCRGHGLRRVDLTTDHVSGLIAFLQRTLSDLSAVVVGNASHGLRVQFEAAASVLRAFAATGAGELSRGKWPSRGVSETEANMLVTAADYWKGKEMEELFAAADAVSDREPWFDKARAVFLEQLGDAGEGMLRTELERLGKRPEELMKADIAHIADRVSVDLSAVADVVDLPQEKDRIQKQIESIRQRLELIAEEPK